MKLVVFDVDGTLVNSQALILGAMDAAMASTGFPPPVASEVMGMVGLSLPILVAKLLPQATPADHARVVEAYRAAFLQRRVGEEAPLYPGALECLDRLGARADLLLGVATGKSQRGLDAMIAHNRLEGRFVTRQSADHHPSKPNPGMLLAALSEAGVEPGDAIMVGDTTYDIDMARAAGVAAIGVAWGYHEVADLGATGVAVAADFPELTRMIEGWAA